MTVIERYYLIDYENVGAGGLTGCNTLKKGEHVIIFFTPNATKIDMKVIADLGGANLELIGVPAGKQSTDIHIGSYIGFLAGIIDERKRSMQRYPEAQELEHEFSVVIVSKDKDYDNVLKFWREKTGIKVARTEAIRPSRSEKDVTEPKKAEVKKAEAQKIEVKKAEVKKAEVQKIEGKKPEVKPEEALAEVKVVEEPKAKPKKAKKKPGKKAEPAGAEEMKTEVLPVEETVAEATKADVKKAGTKKAGKTAKKAPAKAAENSEETKNKKTTKKVTKPTGDEAVALNNQIQKVLSKAKIASEVIGYVAPLAVKKHGSEDGKQQVYKTLVAKYGQEQGLDIYNKIKKIL